MAAGATYEPIATTTLGSAASTITFSSIPSTYTDLRIVLTETQTSGTWPYLQFNTDTGTNYSFTALLGSGSAASSFANTTGTFINFSGSNSLSTTIPAFISIDIFSYAGSTYKTCLTTLSNDQNGSGWVTDTVGLWRSTAAINKVVFKMAGGGSFAAGSTATLYGIKAA